MRRAPSPRLRAAALLPALLLACVPLAFAATSDEHYASGVRRYLSGDVRGAVQALREALALEPSHQQARRLLIVLEKVSAPAPAQASVLPELTTALEVQQIDAAASSLRQENAALKTQLDEVSGRLQRVHEKFERAQRDMNASLAKAFTAQRVAEDALVLSTQQLEALQQDRAALQAQLQRAPSSAAGSDEALARVSHELEQTTGLLMQREASIRELQEGAVRSKHTAAAFEDLERLNVSLTAQVEDAEAQHERVAAALEETRQAQTSLADQLASAQQQLEQARVREEELRGQLTQSGRLAQQASAQQAEGQRQLSDVEEQLAAEQRQRRQLQEQLAERESALQQAEQLRGAWEQEREAARTRRLDVDTRLETLAHERDSLVEQLRRAVQEGEETAREGLRARAALEEESGKLRDVVTRGEQRIAQLDTRFAALTKERDSANQQLAQAQKRLTASERERQELQQRVDQTRQDTGTLHKQVEAVRRTQDTLEQHVAGLERLRTEQDKQLRASADERARLEAGLDEQQRATEALIAERTTAQQQLAERNAALAEAQAAVTQLTQQLRADTAELASAHQDRDSASAETLKQLQTVTAERDRLQAEAKAHKEQARREQERLGSRVQALEREIAGLRSSERALRDAAQGRVEAEQDAAQRGEQLKQELAATQAQLQDAEFVIRRLQQRADVPRSTAADSGAWPLGSTGRPESMAAIVALQPNPETDTVDIIDLTSGHEVQIYDVDLGLGVVVFSVEEMSRVQVGEQFLLEDRGQPMATVRLTELDSTGYAIARIEDLTDPANPPHKGDTLIARPIQPQAIP